MIVSLNFHVLSRNHSFKESLPSQKQKAHTSQERIYMFTAFFYFLIVTYQDFCLSMLKTTVSEIVTLWFNLYSTQQVQVYLSWSEVKSLSRVRLFATPWTVAYHSWDIPWDFPGKSTGVGCHFLLQGIFPIQGSNLGLPHCRQMLYHLSHQGSPPIFILNV